MSPRRRAHGSVYKRRRPDGELEETWSIAYRAGGRRVTERAYTDRKASEALLAQKLRDAARDEAGIGDPYRKHRGRPLSEHLDDFLASLGSRNCSPRYRGLVRARLLRAFTSMSATRIGDLDLAKADKFLAELVEGGQSVKTRDHYAMALRQFGLWLLDSDRCGRNPFHKLHGVATAADVTRERMALTGVQVRHLVAAAADRPVFEYRKQNPQALPETLARLAQNGRHRGLLYLFSALTGLRSSECKGVRWCDLDLTGLVVTPRAWTTKAKRREPLPLTPRLAEALLQWRLECAKQRGGHVPPATEAVFAVPKNLPEQLRKDAKHAEIPLVDDHGRRLDFHALRATFATIVAKADVPLHVGSGLVRHRDPKLTAKHYEKLQLSDLRAGSDLVEELFWNDPPVAQTSASETPTEAHPGAQGRDVEPGERSGSG